MDTNKSRSMKIFISFLLMLIPMQLLSQDSITIREFQMLSIEIRYQLNYKLALSYDIVAFNSFGLFAEYNNVYKEKYTGSMVKRKKIGGKKLIEINRKIEELFNEAEADVYCNCNSCLSEPQNDGYYTVILRKNNKFKVLNFESCLPQSYSKLLLFLFTFFPKKHYKFLAEKFIRCTKHISKFDCYHKH